MLRRLGAEPVEVRKPEQLDGLDGLIVPGGESTAITRLMRRLRARGGDPPLRAARCSGTCAGMILLDREPPRSRRRRGRRRNAYGRQVASFEADLELAGEEEPLRGVFIRAPRVSTRRRRRRGARRARRRAVLLREGRILVASFHPELTDDTRVHERFLEMVQGGGACRA